MTAKNIRDEKGESAVLISRREVLAGALTLAGAASTSVLGGPNSSGLTVFHASVSRDVLAEQFRQPPLQYAPVDTYWWETGHVHEKKLIRHYEEMRNEGVRGTWFYVRWVHGESLSADPTYWSEEWWALTRFAVEEHRRLGMTYYFSNWTLNQFQQDLVRKERERNPDIRGRIVAIRERDASGTIELAAGEQLLDAAAYRKAGASIDYSSRMPLTQSVRNGRLEWQSPGRGWAAVVLVTRPWDLDYLSETVGKRFSELFLGEYERRLPEFIGNTMESFGADELILLNGQALFSDALLDCVRNARKYDLRPYLIGLFYDIGPITDKIRCDYYDAMTSLLEQNFYRAPSAWLERRGMKHSTQSQIGADAPLMQTAQLGDFFRYLRTFHIPGNEDPGRTNAGDRRLLQCKLSSSVAHLYGRARAVVLECYGSGWGQTQQENVACTNEAYAKGLNLYTRHGNVHGLLAGWYEWVPPEDHFYQPTWRYWGKFIDYVTRLSFILSQGTHRADVALLYPVSTFHAHWVAGRAATEWSMEQLHGDGNSQNIFEAPAAKASETMRRLAEVMYHDGLDFNFIDNESLERATIRGNILDVSGVEMRSIVLPAMTTIRMASARKVCEFYERGGTVLSFGELPTSSADNGRDDSRLRALFEAVFGDTIHGKATSHTNLLGGHAYFEPENLNMVPKLLTGAIVRDVESAEKELFHLHKKLGELDVYFLFNVSSRARHLSVRFRAQGNVERWDAATGDSRPVYECRQDGETTAVRLGMSPNEGTLIIFSPGAATPTVMQSNLDEVVRVAVSGTNDTLSVECLDGRGGAKRVRLLHEGKSYVAEGHIPAPPPRIALESPFDFRMEPTMDNRWGDFRYPPADGLIGAEARRFRYAEEMDADGVRSGWQRADFEDAHWPEVTYSYGPYWWHFGPAPPGTSPESLLEQIERGQLNARTDGREQLVPGNWEPYVFSKKYGAQRLLESPGDGLLGVIENFFVLNQTAAPAEKRGDLRHYLYTNVCSPEKRDCEFQVGVIPKRSDASGPYPEPAMRLPTGVRAWLNGEDTHIEFRPDAQDCRVKVHLKEGWNTVLLEVKRPSGHGLAFYAALFSSAPPAEERYVPLVRWFREPDGLTYDLTPRKAKRVGWYRFKAPPGVRTVRVHTNARAMRGWIDGKEVSIESGIIRLESAKRAVSQMALRVEQESGSYGGAAFIDPVAFECEGGEISLGDWSAHGLATYSGVGIYTKEVSLSSIHLKGKIILDLGQVRSVAEVFVNDRLAGVTLAEPYRFDISDLVHEGRNRIEIKVANTLANHMSTYPTQWVFEGQTASGLLGPVEILFVNSIGMTAKAVT